jgi:hypothetical protein
LQKITQHERQIQELREEVVQANQLRKQQLVELGLLREEEKQKMLREHESEVSPSSCTETMIPNQKSIKRIGSVVLVFSYVEMFVF